MSLKPGVETGSMMNVILSGTVGEPIPVVGMGGTMIGWTDREPVTIIKVTPCTVTVQVDKSIRTDTRGMSEEQDYRYERDPEGSTIVFRKTKRGWRQTGGGRHLRIGERDKYHDYSF